MNINKIFPYGLELNIVMHKNGIVRNHDDYTKWASIAYDDYELVWSVFNKDTEQNDTVAIMELNCARFEDLVDMINVSDESGELILYAESIDEYCRKHDDVLNMIVKSEWFNVVIMQTCYINPAYRGKGLSDYLILQLPQIVADLGYDPIVRPTFVTTTIRPYKQTDITVEQPSDLPNNQIDTENCYIAKKECPKMKEIIQKNINKCGFEHVYDDCYVAVIKDMYKISRGYIEELRPILKYDFF